MLYNKPLSYFSITNYGYHFKNGPPWKKAALDDYCIAYVEKVKTILLQVPA